MWLYVQRQIDLHSVEFLDFYFCHRMHFWKEIYLSHVIFTLSYDKILLYFTGGGIFLCLCESTSFITSGERANRCDLFFIYLIFYT